MKNPCPIVGIQTTPHGCVDANGAHGIFSEEAILNFTLDVDVETFQDQAFAGSFDSLPDGEEFNFDIDFNFDFDSTVIPTQNKPFTTNTKTTTSTMEKLSNFNTHYINKPAHLNTEEAEQKQEEKEEEKNKPTQPLCLGLVLNWAQIQRANEQRAFEEKEKLRKARVQRYLKKRRRKKWCSGKRILYPGRRQQSLNRTRILGRFVKAKKAK